MRKYIALFLVIITLLALCSCGGTGFSDVDIDLSILSDTVAYAELSNITSTPEEYVGKVIRVKGTYTVNPADPENGVIYYFVCLNDATACCYAYTEFIWAGNHQYPDDYPADGTEILVTGVFEPYMEGTSKYYHLNNATVEF